MGVGICRGGTVGCDLFGNVTCQGQQLPQPESCSTLVDDDCDGTNECTPARQWLFRLNDPPNSACTASGLRAMTVDNQGNSLLAGWFQDTLTFGGTSLTAQSSDLFLAKLDVNGQPVWGQVIPGQFLYTRIIADGTGNVTVAAVFEGLVNLGGLTLGSTGQRSLLVAKFSPGGSLLWAKISSLTDWLSLTGLNGDSAGNVALWVNPGEPYRSAARCLNQSRTTHGKASSSWRSSCQHRHAALEPNRGRGSFRSWDPRGAGRAEPHGGGGVLLRRVHTGWSGVHQPPGTHSLRHQARRQHRTGVLGPITGQEDVMYLQPRVKVDGAGNVVVLGATSSAIATLTKFSPQGQELWSHGWDH